jgi:cysteine desulfurase/selenocysteine lyase
MPSITEIRNDFPILQQEVHGHPLAFLDSAASSQKPLQVIEAMDRYYRTTHANVHRGVHTLSENATAAYENARLRVARFVNAASPKEIIYTRNATESLNLVAYSWGRANLGPGDEVLITEMEHHSNIVPWQLICEMTGATLRYVPITPQGELDFDALDELLTERTKVFAFTAMSNVLGTINPVAELVGRAHAVGAIAVVDGAQSVPHLATDVQALDADFLAFSSHKMLGPTGVGVLYGKRALLEAMPPFLGGGDMIREVKMTGSSWNDLPYKFEAGTPAIAEAIGLGVAVDYLNNLSMIGWRRMSAGSRPMPGSKSIRSRECECWGPAPTSGVDSWLLSWATSIPTTLPRCWTWKASPYAPATTAPSPSTTTTASAPPPAPASTCTTPKKKLTGSWRHCTKRKKSSHSSLDPPVPNNKPYGRPLPRKHPRPLPLSPK